MSTCTTWIPGLGAKEFYFSRGQGHNVFGMYLSQPVFSIQRGFCQAMVARAKVLVSARPRPAMRDATPVPRPPSLAIHAPSQGRPRVGWGSYPPATPRHRTRVVAEETVAPRPRTLRLTPRHRPMRCYMDNRRRGRLGRNATWAHPDMRLTPPPPPPPPQRTTERGRSGNAGLWEMKARKQGRKRNERLLLAARARPNGRRRRRRSPGSGGGPGRRVSSRRKGPAGFYRKHGIS